MLGQRGPEGATPVLRVGSHVVILLVALGVLLLSRARLPASTSSEEAPADDGDRRPGVRAGRRNAGEVTTAEVFGLTREAVPITLIPERPRVDVIEHTVVAGDTLYGIAKKFGLNAETIMFANGLEKNPDLLRLGQKLIILPVNGILHTVAQKDTLDKIAKTYKVKPEAIVTYALNSLDAKNPQIAVGQKLIVPGGKKEIPQVATVYRGTAPKGAKTGTGRLIWPTSGPPHARATSRCTGRSTWRAASARRSRRPTTAMSSSQAGATRATATTSSSTTATGCRRCTAT